MQRENLNDCGLIVENILGQPLFIIGASGHVTLLTAAEEFSPETAEDSTLSKVMFSFVDYPAPTEAMLTELEILAHELEDSL